MFTKLKSKICSFIDMFREWNKTKIILFFFILFFFFLSSFSTMAFSSRYPLNYLNIAIYCILILLIITFVALYGVFRFDIYFIVLFLFNVVVIISSIFNVSKNFNYTLILVASTSFFIYQLLINVDDNLQKTLLAALFIGGALFSFYFFIIYRDIILNFDFSLRIGDYFDNLNEMAKYFVFLSLISFYLILFKRRYGHIILFLVFFIFLVWTGSRSNLLTLIFMILLLLYFRFPKKQKKYFALSLIVFLILGVFIFQLDFMKVIKQRFYDSFITLFYGGKGTGVLDYSTEFRKIALYEAFELFSQRPLFGYGYHGTILYSFYRMAAHNNFVALLGNFGIFAFILFQAFLLFPIYSFIKKNGGKNSFVLLTVILALYIFVFQLFLINYYTKIEYFIMPFSYAVLKPNIRNYLELNLKRKKISLFITAKN